MPKSSQYSKGSIVFFQGDKDENIYILQSGAVVLQSLDLETGAQVAEPLHTGEFFGVKSALAHMPSLVTACVVEPSVIVQMTVAEFEKLFSTKQAITEKMLRVFSKSLRDIHKKTEQLLKSSSFVSPEVGMYSVAQAFYNDGLFSTCVSVLERIFKLSPRPSNSDQIRRLLEDAKDRAAHENRTSTFLDSNQQAHGGGIAVNQFSLPVFDRFTKNYKSGDLIISEYEPGETFYLIKSGEVQITKCIKDQNKCLDILSSGSFFGEMAILDNSQRSASCIARTDVSCLEFNKENFKALVLSNAQIVMTLLKLFCKRIYDQNRQFKILLISDISARVADVFLMQDELAGTATMDDETNPKRKFSVTIGDIASWAAISHQQAHDELNRLSKQGKIEVFENYMVIRNIHDMRRTVDTYYTKLKAAAERNKV